ncbi:YwdI family protein [Alkalihalophilus marmarensis]|uniref:YwdI family protein n=1 Tax=Alkalihalophilus marmarensis TaxID=521377 RepID=UPI002DB78446|nr:YwdI family protein [Alkalihalophilus marmarensis]MEC2072840.1 YwdI family protein [Alkalihalophilus marmarensis]
MNISGKSIVNQMEEQVSRLREAVDRGDVSAIREYTAVIESHCQLIKSGTSAKQTEIPAASYAHTPVQATYPNETKMISSSVQQNEPAPPKDNLLDF